MTKQNTDKKIIRLIGICLLGGFLLMLCGCGKKATATGDEAATSGQAEENDAAAVERSSNPEAILAAYRASAEALGLRDESNPDLGAYLYFDEATELLYRLSVHGIDPAMLPAVGTVVKRTNEDGDRMIEATIHADAVIWIEAVSVLPRTPANREAAAEQKIQQLQEAFAKYLREQGKN
jgi:hypothetical protein